MRNPWQIWLVFLLCLAVVIPAMAWLSYKAIEVDALRETDRIQTELARQEAELQERISSALYRMDLKLLPLVAQEAARPHYLYQPFYKVNNPTVESPNRPEAGSGDLRSAASGPVDVPSPLLFEPPEFVILHFQIGPENQITSPQRPVGKLCEQAIVSCGITQSNIDDNSVKVSAANNFFDYNSLLLKCPEIKIPQIAINNPGQQMVQSLSGVYNVPAIEKIRDQINYDKSERQSVKGTTKTQAQSKYEQQRSRGNYRTNEEFNRRRDSTKNFAGQQWAQTNAFDSQLAMGKLDAETISNLNIAADPTTVREGVMQPIWVHDNLVLARRVDGQEKPVIQCCWLDWEAIQNSLKAEVADLLPDLKFQPVKTDTDLNLGTALTTIPVQLVVDSPRLLSTLAFESGQTVTPISGLKLSLLVAWCGLALAAFASALLLHGVMKLSERRATFVSAVTHELRTPLTTFRMYAEMLAENMVPEGKQQEYANTLRVQADRLSHLVENVLQFARLERGAAKDKTEVIAINDLFDRFAARLVERANEADMKLSIDIDESIAGRKIETQASAIEQVMFNLVDNACKYAKPSSDNRIEVSCKKIVGAVQFCVRDHGPGVAPKYKRRMFQPFCKSDQDAANSAQGVGLGLALCCRMASSLGGRLFHRDCNDGAMFVLEVPA